MTGAPRAGDEVVSFRRLCLDMEDRETFPATVVGTAGDGRRGVFEFDASVVVVWEGGLHLWVGGHHFVDDDEGCVQRGQYLLVTTPVTGVLARIVDADASGAPDPARRVTVEREWSWDGATGASSAGDGDSDVWSDGAITGAERHPLGEDAAVRFVRPTSR